MIVAASRCTPETSLRVWHTTGEGFVRYEAVGSLAEAQQRLQGRLGGIQALVGGWWCDVVEDNQVEALRDYEQRIN